MPAVIIEWNPSNAEWAGTYAADVEAVRRWGVVRKRWQLPDRVAVEPGTDAWLVILTGPTTMQGLIGHGTLAGAAEPPQAHGTTPVEIDFDALLPHGDQVALSLLAERVPGLQAGPRRSIVDGEADAAIRLLWAEACTSEAGSVEPVPGSLPPSATKRVQVNRYERDPDLRRVAVAHRGSACQACGLDFEQVYGVSGDGLIQLHHVTPLRHLDAGYEIDPLVDLVPLCATCHVVAHSRWPNPYSVEEIRGMMRRSGFLHGTVVSEEQQAAEKAAARILGR